jgi:hypothetical protein
MDLLQDLYAHDDGLPDSLLQLMRAQGVELPCKTEGALVQIFSQHGSYLERIAAADQGWEASGSGQFAINTFPFGAKTTDVFSEFLGVCTGKTTLRSTLNAVKKYCRNIQKVLPRNDEKTVVVLTDKWDGPLFHANYELDFLRCALEGNVLFIFLLVTDYGVTRIPFLAKNRKDLRDLRQMNYAIEPVHPDVMALERLKQAAPCVFVIQSGTWTRPGFPEYQDTRYEFDFHSGLCTIFTADAAPQLKNIPAAAARRFALVAYTVCHMPNSDHAERAITLDAGQCYIEVFGSYFDWDITVRDGADTPRNRLFAAVQDLISALT